MVGWIDAWWLRMALGLIGSAAIAMLAYRFRSLSASGSWAAVVMGTGYVTLGSPVWFGALIVFFGTSTVLSKFKRRHHTKRNAEANYAKGSRRDAGQVWANGGLGLILCSIHAIWPEPVWLYAFIGVMASVNADTWATELGAISRAQPRALLGGARVAPGTSGGVTLLGSAAALAGAAVVAAASALLSSPLIAPGQEAAHPLGLIALGSLAGTAGAFADSFLGATVQVMYRCRICGKQTERAVHCGTAAQKIRGWGWMTNDAVNLLSSAAAALLAAMAGIWLG
ncbi:DUF92 domain-containing protein [Paenibacillus nasutitermitis]|uniref:DUF92 domain-containing protein n=1 Tax=Paenibacillus nasutitermitis TaxID=1652958 RepID=A0A917DW02_9BACL|nr:DUF92 domain-containing protein [Paenibacillus nasutitermitis]GGD73927.1 hypothetical protein GCM10010911_34770 [Paenibacillus nasutitermitis]